MPAHVFASGEVATAAELNSTLPPVLTQAGVVRVTPVANTATAIPVKFPVPFTTQAPRVFVTPQTIYPGSSVKGCSVGSVTTTGFTLYIYRVNNTPTVVSWQAWVPRTVGFVDDEPGYASLLAMAGKALRPQSGTINITPVSGVATGGNVTFPVPFLSEPTVIATVRTTVPGTTVLMPSVANITPTGCTVYLYRESTTATPINWIALGRM